MLSANQLHKQSQLQMDFQDFLSKMKEAFGENFMEKVNEGKVALQEIQSALGLMVTPEKSEQEKPQAPVQRRRTANPTKNVEPKVQVKKVTKSATGDAGFKPKCSSCEKNKKNATGEKGNTMRNVLIFAGIGAVLFWAVKNRR